MRPINVAAREIKGIDRAGIGTFPGETAPANSGPRILPRGWEVGRGGERKGTPSRASRAGDREEGVLGGRLRRIHAARTSRGTMNLWKGRRLRRGPAGSRNANLIGS
jgi:hypothetical protein